MMILSQSFQQRNLRRHLGLSVLSIGWAMQRVGKALGERCGPNLGPGKVCEKEMSNLTFEVGKDLDQQNRTGVFR